MNPPPPPSDEARRRALDIVDRLMAEAKAGRMPDLAGALARLREVDPALQRRIADAMVRSRGDVAAVRAALEASTQEDATSPDQRGARVPVRPPTVVDGRGRLPWRVFLVAALAAAATTALIASGGQ